MEKTALLPQSTFCKRLLLTGLIIFFGIHSLAPESRGQEQMPESQVSVTEPVMVDGKKLFRLGGVSSYPAKERARAVAGRIRKLAKDKTIDPEKLKITSEGGLTVIKDGDFMVIGLAESDAAREGISLEILADLVRQKIAQSIMEYRNDRAPRTLLINSGYALLVTVLAALLLWVILRAFAWLDAFTQRRLMARLERLESKAHYIFDAEQVGDMLGGVENGESADHAGADLFLPEHRARALSLDAPFCTLPLCHHL